MSTKTLKYKEENNAYQNVNYIMKRESGKTPNGNELNYRWVLRDSKGTFIDYDIFRDDLAGRNNLELI